MSVIDATHGAMNVKLQRHLLSLEVLKVNYKYGSTARDVALPSQVYHF